VAELAEGVHVRVVAAIGDDETPHLGESLVATSWRIMVQPSPVRSPWSRANLLVSAAAQVRGDENGISEGHPGSSFRRR
jgi:hypothetical protein